MKSSLPVVQAKEEYTSALKKAIDSNIITKFLQMFEMSKNDSEINQCYRNFQIKLKGIPQWTSATIENELNKIHSNCSWFNELLTAVIVTNVKILTSVKISKTKKKIQLKVPQPEKFIHKVYIQIAKTLYENIQDKCYSVITNKNELRNIVLSSIDEVIHKELPIQNILQMYVGENSLSSEEDSDSETEQENDKNQELNNDSVQDIEDNEPQENLDENQDEDFQEEENEQQTEVPGSEHIDSFAKDVTLGNTDKEFTKTENDDNNHGIFDPPEIKNVQLKEDNKVSKCFFEDAASDPTDD